MDATPPANPAIMGIPYPILSFWAKTQLRLLSDV
jgi:hypothetical protein